MDNSLFLPTTLASTTGTAVAFNASGQMGPQTSSIRFKENVKDSEDLTHSFDLIKVKSYTRKPQGDMPPAVQPIEYGLIAEELDLIYPQFVPKNLENEPFSVNYDRLTLILIQEVQKLRKRVASLESRVV